jgi:hypothetical protein
MRKPILTVNLAAAGLMGLLLVGGDLLAQQAPAGQPQGGQPPAGQSASGQPAAGQQPGGRRGGGPRGAQPYNAEDRTGFESIFDGTSLKGWDGDPAFWKAEGGAIVGVSTEANAVKENTFVIYQTELADFELKLEYRMNSTNSGIQFRSTRVPPGGEGRGAVTGKWVLKGYQADIDFNNQFTGMIYEERGRGFLMQRGQAVYIGADGVSKQIGQLERNADELKALIKANEWNTVHLIARGNVITNVVNGHVTAFLVDDDAKGRAMKGFLGFQIHTGPPMKIEYRNIYVKKL